MSLRIIFCRRILRLLQFAVPHVGKIAGVVVGFFAGLGILGPIFGLVIGYFIDEARMVFGLRNKIAAFPATPKGVRLSTEEVWIAGSASLAVAVVAAGPDHGEVRFQILAGEIRQDLDLSGRYASIVETVVKAAVCRDIDVEGIADRLGSVLGNKEKVSSLALCIRIASMNTNPTESQRFIIRSAATRMGLDSNTYSALWAGFVAPDASAYELLGVPVDAETGDIKRVYKRLASQFHPDGGVALTQKQLAQSEEAFKKIVEAYRTVMKERGEVP